jgi:hypothetical protein
MKLEGLRKLVKEELAKVVTNESLIRNKELIADKLDSASIPDNEFAQGSKSTAVYFIRNGRPSELYLKDIMSLLQKYNIDISFNNDTTQEPYIPTSKQTVLDPYDMPGGRPSKSSMGGFYTGD